MCNTKMAGYFLPKQTIKRKWATHNAMDFKLNRLNGCFVKKWTTTLLSLSKLHQMICKMPRGTIVLFTLNTATCKMLWCCFISKKDLYLSPRLKAIATPIVTCLALFKGMKPKLKSVQYPGVSLCRRIPFPLPETPAFKDVHKEGNPGRDHLTPGTCRVLTEIGNVRRLATVRSFFKVLNEVLQPVQFEKFNCWWKDVNILNCAKKLF